uniref:Putative LAGLIDADG homing endonuclease n=1 Tax=Neodangemannia microcystis TaxID=173495 RepID=A0A1W6EHG4_9CHLO|nr:putative LAGLIDADG homing endonuclease [Neodangemannia microcystis]YP_009367833.1 putative LAGLIDADG homing endonuclease [Neodangemannia microcystis]ARK14806.1 putative LAGLIDADG homing endonuclease [Neodangemannia microcystis]ARK14810.1 putative LAGLIDADG homing endonuclease [Neodangemannia microcystis]
MNKLKKLTKEDFSYLAGFLDGDGCINAQIVKRDDYALGFQIRVSITFFQKTKSHWFFIKLQNQLGYGTLRKRPDGMSEYAIVGPASVKNLLTQLKPYIVLKKPQLKLLLIIIEQMPHIKNDPTTFLKLCKKVDQFSTLNNSKKRTITHETVLSTLSPLIKEYICIP